MNSHTFVRPTRRQALGQLTALVENALTYEREAFDAPPEQDAYVSGADLVDWFSRWRDRAKVALHDAKQAKATKRPQRRFRRRA